MTTWCLQGWLSPDGTVYPVEYSHAETAAVICRDLSITVPQYQSADDILVRMGWLVLSQNRPSFCSTWQTQSDGLTRETRITSSQEEALWDLWMQAGNLTQTTYVRKIREDLTALLTGEVK